jgi:hypothetical protein
MSRPKFGTIGQNGTTVPHDYGNIYYRQSIGDSERLVIGPTDSQIKLLDGLASTFPTHRYYVLYVLLLSHSGRRPGRYESPLIENHEALQIFMWTFQNYFEGDARHHLWIASSDSSDLLVYDQHDVIFGYGDLGTFENVLDTLGFKQSEFWFPSPHVHSYDPGNADTEDKLMSHFDWRFYDLQRGDEWE